MAWGLKNLFKAMGNQKGFERKPLTEAQEQVKRGGPVQSIADTDYGRQLRGEKSPEYNDMMEGQFTNREERNFAKRFDPSSEEDVLRMQQKLNAMGYADEEGNPLAEDAMFGPKTERALRKFQGVEEEESPEYDTGGEPEYDAPVEEVRKPTGSDGRGWKDWFFGGGR